MTKKKTIAKKVDPGTTVSNCNFYGVHWDAKAIESVHTTAKALLNLTELFKSQNINIHSMLYIEHDKIQNNE